MNLGNYSASVAGIGGGITTLIETETSSVFNLTQSDHTYHDGYVRRQIVVMNGGVYVRTTGEGVNSSLFTMALNNATWSTAFIGSNVRIRHFMIDTWRNGK